MQAMLNQDLRNEKPRPCKPVCTVSKRRCGFPHLATNTYSTAYFPDPWTRCLFVAQLPPLAFLLYSLPLIFSFLFVVQDLRKERGEGRGLKGEFEITPRFFATGIFQDGLCFVETENNISYVNRQGDAVWSGGLVEQGRYDPYHLLPRQP